MLWILNILHKQQQVLTIYISISFAVLDHTFSSLAMYSQTALALYFDWAIPPNENVFALNRPISPLLQLLTGFFF